MPERLIMHQFSDLQWRSLKLGKRLFAESVELENPMIGFGTIVIPDFDSSERYAYVVVDIYGKSGIETARIISLKKGHEIISMNTGGHDMKEYVDKVSDHPPLDAKTIMRGYDNFLKITMRDPSAIISDELRKDILKIAERSISIPRY